MNYQVKVTNTGKMAGSVSVLAFMTSDVSRPSTLHVLYILISIPVCSMEVELVLGLGYRSKLPGCDQRWRWEGLGMSTGIVASLQCLC